MDKEKLLTIFNELLDQWYWSEETVISEYSGEITKAREKLEEKRKVYQEDFLKALNDNSNK